MMWSNKKILVGVAVFTVLLALHLLTTDIFQPEQSNITFVENHVRSEPRVRQAPFLDGNTFESYRNTNYYIRLFDSVEEARQYTYFGAEKLGWTGETEVLSVPRLDMKEEVLEKFPSVAPHYLPNYYIHSVDKLDVTNDGDPELIVYYSCHGCNAPARNVDIISGNRLIFTAEGGNLSIQPLSDKPGFILSNLMIPRVGHTDITFELSDYGEFWPTREEDFYDDK